MEIYLYKSSHYNRQIIVHVDIYMYTVYTNLEGEENAGTAAI